MLYPLYAPKTMFHVHGRQMEGREGPSPWILKFGIFLLQRDPATFDLRTILQKRDNSWVTSNKMM